MTEGPSVIGFNVESYEDMVSAFKRAIREAVSAENIFTDTTTRYKSEIET